MCGVKIFNSDESANVAALYAEGFTQGVFPQVIIIGQRVPRWLQPFYGIAP
jgi:hypothetical protein